MFEHSVKVPRHYKVAANIFKKVATEGGSVKNLLYNDKLKHFRTNVLYALITETIKHANDIDKIFETSGILANEQRLDPWLAKVLTAELLFGKKSLPGKSKPELTILSYKEQFESFRSENPDEVKSKVVRRPRYVRINTNLLTTSDAIRAFQDEGYKFVRCTSGSYDDYLQQIQSLSEYDFTQDYHVKTMFVFAPSTKLHNHDLYLENQIILQDKATALAVHLLAPPPGSTVLDMCAAPGMKTTQLAAYLRNQGKIYAVERNADRYETLCKLVESTFSKCVETIHKDVLEIKRGELDNVEYILLDPSCSGSGMEFSVHSYIEATRLAKLTSLQEKFLKHAMNAFPNAKRIVYSTCSLFPEENERVVTNVVKTSRAKWRVQDVKKLLKGQWNNFGSAMYGSMGTRCLYASPDSDKTTGFFLAVLDRDQRAPVKGKKSLDADSIKKHHKTDSKQFSNDNVDPESEINVVEDASDVIVRKKNKKDRKQPENESEVQQDIIEVESNLKEDNVEKQKKKKHKKNKSQDDNDGENLRENLVQELEGNVAEVVIKKKKKSRKICSEIENVIEEPKDIIEESKNKNKRKKTKSIEQDKSFEEMIVQNEDVEELQDAVEVPLKKKKKKSKEESTSVDISVSNSMEVSEDIVIEHKKKKKKKHEKQ